MFTITMYPISAYADTADETSKVINAVNSGEAINNTDNFYMIGANWGGKKTQERCTNMLDDESCPVDNQFNRGMMFSHNDFNHISSVIDGKYQDYI